MARLSRSQVQPLIRQALAEDRAERDATSRALLHPGIRIRARLLAKAPGVIAGLPVAIWIFKTVDPLLRCAPACREGAAIRRGQTLLRVEGSARSILAAERTALNFLGHLSGVATLTREFVRRVPRRVSVLDTRKTLPGLRVLEKYAVRVGGGHNHRMGLHDAVLIKTNHLRVLRGSGVGRRGSAIRIAIQKAKRLRPRRFVEVEVTNLRECHAALLARPDAILLDNWSVALLRRAVRLRDHSSLDTRHSTLLEASGGVTLANVRAIARTGVERISIGRLTHSAPALDVALEVVGKS
jgi:nicotinate-nucleotide pyrophosphorylase (carboxylating)